MNMHVRKETIVQVKPVCILQKPSLSIQCMIMTSVKCKIEDVRKILKMIHFEGSEFLWLHCISSIRRLWQHHRLWFCIRDIRHTIMWHCIHGRVCRRRLSRIRGRVCYRRLSHARNSMWHCIRARNSAKFLVCPAYLFSIAANRADSTYKNEKNDTAHTLEDW